MKKMKTLSFLLAAATAAGILGAYPAVQVSADVTELTQSAELLDTLYPFQTAHGKVQPLADVRADALALGVVHPLHHELQHLLVGLPQIFHFVAHAPVANLSGF